jgi:hypothetical protein
VDVFSVIIKIPTNVTVINIILLKCDDYFYLYLKPTKIFIFHNIFSQVKKIKNKYGVQKKSYGF